MQKCGFNKVALQLYCNHTSTWVLSCKFAAYFQNIFFLRTPLKGCFCTYLLETMQMKVEKDAQIRKREFISSLEKFYEDYYRTLKQG